MHSIDRRIALLAFEYQHMTGFLLSESVFSFSFDGNNEIQDHKIADIVARGRFSDIRFFRDIGSAERLTEEGIIDAKKHLLNRVGIV